MTVNIIGHQVKITERMRSYIESKLPRVQKYSDRVQSIDVKLEKDGYQHLSELIFKAGPVLVTAKSKDVNPRRAIDLLFDKAEMLLKKKFAKIRGKDKHAVVFNRKAKKANLSPDAEPLPLIEKGLHITASEVPTNTVKEPVLHEKLNIRIITQNKSKTNRMTVQEAAEALYFKDDQFLCFKNAETDTLNVLFRRKDGNFGMIAQDV